MHDLGRSVRTCSWGRQGCADRAGHTGMMVSKIPVDVGVRVLLVGRVRILRGLAWQGDQLLPSRDCRRWGVRGIRLPRVASGVMVTLLPCGRDPMIRPPLRRSGKVGPIPLQQLVVGFHAF